MKKKEENAWIAVLALHGLCRCSGRHGNSLSCATHNALDAVDAVGGSSDYRDLVVSDVVRLCACIRLGHIRATDCDWTQPPERDLLRLAKLAEAWATGRSEAHNG